MAILAENKGKQRELIPQGNYIARCYQMIEIGTVTEEFEGQTKTLKKVLIGWELPTELRVFDEAKGEQPMVKSNEYTLSMHEKAKLRGVLESWRGKAFSEDEAKGFDITKLIGATCMLNIIHKVTPNGTYANISSVTPIPKGLTCPDAINEPFILSYDVFDYAKFMGLPGWIKDKMDKTPEFTKATVDKSEPQETAIEQPIGEIDSLPF